MTDPGDVSEAGHQAGLEGEKRAELCCPGVSTPAGDGAQHSAAKPAGGVLVPEVYGRLCRPEVQQVEDGEVNRHSAAAEDSLPANFPSGAAITFLQLRLVLGGPTGGYEEGQEGEEEHVVGQDEDEADHESHESTAGGERLPVVGRADQHEGRQGGRQPPEGGDLERVVRERHLDVEHGQTQDTEHQRQ